MKKEEESKTVQIEYSPDGSVEVIYYAGDKQVGKPKTFKPVPRRLQFFLEKFPRGPEALKDEGSSDPEK